MGEVEGDPASTCSGDLVALVLGDSTGDSVAKSVKIAADASVEEAKGDTVGDSVAELVGRRVNDCWRSGRSVGG